MQNRFIIIKVKNGGLTEKKMANKRFRKAENAIFIAYCKLCNFPSASRVSLCAKISRSTFYRHHKSPQLILHNYEIYLLNSYSKKMRKLSNKQPADQRNIFLQTIIFIYTHKEVFSALFKSERKGVIDKMWAYHRKRIIADWNLAGDLSRVYDIYQKEILGVIEGWGKLNFTNKKIEDVLTDIVFLTKTAPRRLTRFID